MFAIYLLNHFCILIYGTPEDAAHPVFRLGIGALYADIDLPWQCERHILI